MAPDEGVRTRGQSWGGTRRCLTLTSETVCSVVADGVHAAEQWSERSTENDLEKPASGVMSEVPPAQSSV